MSIKGLENINIASQEILPSPRELKLKLPISEEAKNNIGEFRETIGRILKRKDDRLLVIVGPCSIHDFEAAKEYADKLKKLADELKENIYIVMRVYFEKPRTTVGWKGFINDPYLDDSFKIGDGLLKARELLIHLADIGLPAGTEALDPITPQYLGDLVSWTAIGARTAESQTHREMSSGLSSPVGIKNGTDGNIDVAINALLAVSNSHSFLGIDQDGRCALTKTNGNNFGHMILRGGVTPNYDAASVKAAEEALNNAGLAENIIIDCSHANSNKDPAIQPLVLEHCINQKISGNNSIIGVMLESHLGWGSQKLEGDVSQLKYGVSITDACIDWETTENCLRSASDRLKG